MNENTDKSLGLYIHWPFCQSKCFYCDFASYEGLFSYTDDVVAKMFGELGYYLDNFPAIKFDTVFFGGGTPSLMPIPVLTRLMDKIESRLIPDAEISIEINPTSNSELKLKEYKKLGINRVSFGVQSFDDTILKTLGRLHSSQQAVESYQLAGELFDNINIDLMFGVPGQTMGILDTDLDTIIKLNQAHISIYNLILEEGTPFKDIYDRGELILPDDEMSEQMYSHIIKRLAGAGYRHYEVSNFAKPGKECKHNLHCWENKEYIGIGVGAHSFFDNARYANPDEIKDYLSQNAEEKLNTDISNKLTEKENLGNKMMLGLRMLDGITLDNSEYSHFEKEINKLSALGLIEVSGNRVKLSEKGLFVGNEVFEKFI